MPLSTVQITNRVDNASGLLQFSSNLVDGPTNGADTFCLCTVSADTSNQPDFRPQRCLCPTGFGEAGAKTLAKAMADRATAEAVRQHLQRLRLRRLRLRLRLWLLCCCCGGC